jgi:inorganic pyrophosphatase
LPDGIIKQIENFFKNYNEEAGKKFEVIETVGAEEAYGLLKG